MNRGRLRAQLEQDEGRRSHLYKDTRGFWTIGVGHNLDANGLSNAAIDFIFNEDVDNFVMQLNNQLPWWNALPDHQQEVLVNLCFNMGIVEILGFPKFLGALRIGDSSTAANELINSKAYSEEPNRILRLANILRNGEPDGGQPGTA